MKKNNNDLFAYAGLAFQFLVGIGLMVFVGIKADKYFNFKFPIAVWLLPLLMITAVIYKIIKETSAKK